MIQDIEIQEGSGSLLVELPFSDEEYRRRLALTRKSMAEQDMQIFITFTPENIYYLSGHDTPGYYYFQACVVTHDSLPVVVTRKIESFNTLGHSWSRRVVAYADLDDPVNTLVELLEQLGCSGERVGLELDAWFVKLDGYTRLIKAIEKRGQYLDASGLVESLRLVKSDEELNYIRAGGKACSAAVHAAFEASAAGLTENDVAAAAVAELIRNGGEYAGLPPFISSGPRTSLTHSTWSGRTIEQGDVIAYEIPGVCARYCAALFRSGVIGTPNDEIKQGFDILIEVLEELITASRPGIPACDVHSKSIDVFKRRGLSAPPRKSAYSLGVNYPPDWGEGHIMSFTESEKRPLEPGMVFHVGTGLFEYPRYQIAVTETIIITDSGCELVTDYPRQLVVK
jgi:Xaa-Pro dipeptidase